MHYYPHHIGDYQRDTAHLSVTEHGVYRLLMDHYYATEKPIPSDLPSLCRIIRATTKVEKDAVATVAGQFFTNDGNALSHKRIQAEIAAYELIKQRNQNNGRLGGRKPNPKPPITQSEPSGMFLGNPDGTLPRTSTQEPVPPNPPRGTLPALDLQLSDAVPPKRSKKTIAYTEDFEAFWRIYPRGEGKAEAFEQWRKITDLPPVNELLAIIEQHKKTQAWIDQNGKFIPHCQRWLSKRRWEDKIDLHLGTNGHQPKHPAYTKGRATAGLTAEQIGTF